MSFANPTVFAPPTVPRIGASSKVPRITVQDANQPLPKSSLDMDPFTPTSPSSGERKRDTGFPEPFCSVRNTTLPHPDADLSPNACISQDDISLEPNIKRTRLSFLKNKHRRTISHGTVSPTAAALHGVIAAAHIDTEARPARTDSNSSQALSRTDGESIISAKRESGDVKDDDTPPTSPEDAAPQKRRSFFSRRKD